MTISFSRHQFPPAIIRHAVWRYVRFTLTYRDVEDLLAERGLDVFYETGRRWVLKFGPLFAQELRGSRPRAEAVDAPVLYEGGVWPSGRECRARRSRGQ
jgi:transposase-like protein